MTSFSITPGYTRNMASSRLRAYVLGESLIELGHDVHVGPPILGADVHLFQKPKDLSEFLTFPGEVKIFDFVDVTQKGNLKRLGGRADFVTTSSDNLRDWYMGFPGHAPCYTLPDPIDYSLRPLPLVDHGARKIAFFGNDKNYHRSLRKIHKAIILNTDWEVHLIMAERARANPWLPQTVFHQWRLDNFVETLRECSVAVLNHRNLLTKSDNKISVCASAGLPVIVSQSPSSHRRLEEIGCPQWGADTPRKVVGLLKKMQDREFRLQGLKEAQARVWEDRNPIVIAEKFLEILGEYLDSSKN